MSISLILLTLVIFLALLISSPSLNHDSLLLLTTLPIEEHGFYLNQTAFWDAIHMRYEWKLERMPNKCICGAQFSVEHALTCPSGGFTFIRHNEIRDLTANLLSEVCHGVHTELDLQPLMGETFSLQTANGQDNARLDISARGFWGERQPSLTLGCSTHMHPATVSPHQKHATASMRRRRGGNMKRESC